MGTSAPPLTGRLGMSICSRPPHSPHSSCLSPSSQPSTATQKHFYSPAPIAWTVLTSIFFWHSGKSGQGPLQFCCLSEWDDGSLSSPSPPPLVAGWWFRVSLCCLPSALSCPIFLQKIPRHLTHNLIVCASLLASLAGYCCSLQVEGVASWLAYCVASLLTFLVLGW